MEHYDFTTLRDRSQEGSAKYGMMQASRPVVPAGTVPFSIADMEFVTAQPIVDALVHAAEHQNLGYAYGTEGFVDAVVAWQRRRHHWDPKPEWIVESPGIVPALYFCVRAFSEPGEGVLIQSPVYPPFRSAIEDNGRTVVDSPLKRAADGSYAMDYDDLAEQLARPDVRLMILCSPHNPVGRVWTRPELERLGQLCVDNGVFLVSDEIHGDLTQPGHDQVPMATAMPAGHEEDCLVCVAPSKTFNLAGLQCSTILVPGAGRREALRRQVGLAGIHSLGCFAYVGAQAAYDHCEGWLEALLEVLADNAALVRTHLEARWPQAWMAPLEGTYIAWLDLGFTGATPEELQEACEREALFFDFGPKFGPEGDGFVRWNLACPRSVIEDALPRLDAALQSLVCNRES